MKTPESEVRERLLRLSGPFTIRSAHRALLAQGCTVSWSRVADIISLLVRWDQLQRLPGDQYPSYEATGRPRKEALPTTPCSVVWFDGHPWVLDGEPGVAGKRHWVGVKRDGSLGWMTGTEMAAHHPAVIYRDPGEG